MSELRLLPVQGDRAAQAEALERGWAEGHTLALALPQEQALLAAALPAQTEPSWGAAVVLGSGGSSGGRHWCLQPLHHLQVAVSAAALWLRQQGMDPAEVQVFNPLPLHHVSGLMPLLRARAWGAELRWLDPAWMRNPEQLLAQACPEPAGQALLSLVPTQLQRLLEQPAGRRWLERFSVIWVGGAALPADLARRCRQLALPLSPCYGSTETGAMVAALAPSQFLAGVEGCGQPLAHARLRLAADGALQIQAGSLALGVCCAGTLQPLPLAQGWWSSGDRAVLSSAGLQLQGRLDGAINSGGETVFPEQVEQRFLALCRRLELPVEELLLLPEPDPLWGERLVALVRLSMGVDAARVMEALARQALELPVSQRPWRWLLCQHLHRTALGKWERARWCQWLASQPQR